MMPLEENENSFGGLAYLHDGSLEGILSGIFLAYERHEEPDELVREHDYKPRFGQRSVAVSTDFERARRVKAGLERQAGRDSFVAVMRASACDDYDTGTVINRYVRLAMSRTALQRSLPLLDDLANPIVARLNRLERFAVNECEKMRQFVRFSHLENGVWFAQCNPNASVVPLIMGHFAARLNDQPFIIYDENHQIAGVYNGRSWSLVAGQAVQPTAPTSNDSIMVEAWKRFYDALSIDARYNPELRRHFMPERLWKNLPEMQTRTKQQGGRRLIRRPPGSDVEPPTGIEPATH